MGKPTDPIPTWATDDDYPAGAEPEAGEPTKLEPLAGKKAIGFRPEEYARPQYVNWILYWYGLWLAWLATVRMPFFQLHQTWVGFRPTKEYNLDLRATGISLSNGLGGGENTEAGGGYRASVPIPTGSSVRSWSITIDKTTSGANTVSARLFKRTISTGAAIPLGTLQSNSDANPGVISLGETDVYYEIGPGQALMVEMTCSAWAGGGVEYAYALEVEALEPDPVFHVSITDGGGGNSPTRAGFATVTNTTNKPGSWLELRCFSDDPAAIAVYMRERVTLGPWPDNIHAVLEFSIDATELAGLDESLFQIGLVHDEGLFVSTEDQIKLYKDEASANWMFRTSDSPAGPLEETDTAVPATGVQLIRFDVYGADDAGGYRAELRIDDALVATHTVHLPAGQEMTLQAFFKNEDSVPDDKYVYLSPVTFILETI